MSTHNHTAAETTDTHALCIHTEPARCELEKAEPGRWVGTTRHPTQAPLAASTSTPALLRQETEHSWMGPGLSPRRGGVPAAGAEVGRTTLNAQNPGFPDEV